MRLRSTALACAAVLSAASSVTAQSQPGDSLTPLQVAVACASPPVVTTEPADAVRIVGSQDVVERDTFGKPEVLTLSGGADHGIAVNTMYFARRLYRTAETQHDKLAHSVQTSGWVRVVAVNEKMALVSPEHTCGDIRTGDYLEPFVAPIVPEGDVLAPIVQSELNFALWSKVLYGEQNRGMTGTNEFATVEHGLDRNIRVGTRFAVYRDLQLAQNPLKRIGEAIAVSVGPLMTVVRVTSARDAVFSGDIMVPRTVDGVIPEPPPPPPPATLLSGCQNGSRVPPQNPQCAGLTQH
jgi:hypothetical protein